MAQKPASSRKQSTRAASVDWFKGLFKAPAAIRKQLMKGDDGNRYRNSVQIGRMYAFYYDPKHKDTLPVYDRFPLVMVIDFKKDGFLGLNLHYLSQGQRGNLLDLLMRYANNQNMDETTRLHLSWQAVVATSRMRRLSEKCVKHYLYPHCRSRFVQINADEFDKVSTLPTADFVYKGQI
jgi:hypothetical protein